MLRWEVLSVRPDYTACPELLVAMFASRVDADRWVQAQADAGEDGLVVRERVA